MTNKDEQQAKLDAALDAALDALDDSDDDETSRTKPAAQAPVMGPLPPPPPQTNNNNESPEKVLAEMMQQMMTGIPTTDGSSSGPDSELFGQIMQEVSSQIQQEIKKEESPQKRTQFSSHSSSAFEGPVNKSAVQSPTDMIDDKDVQEAISKLVQGMAELPQTTDDNEQQQPLPEDFLNGIMKGLADLGGDVDGDFNPDSMMDGMMEQLLGKDLMYEPMKQVSIKFPDWLKTHKDSLSEKEYSEREKQYQCFCKLVKVYETEPDNVAKLMDLMQQVQEFGQPPPEIIQEIAPGVELDEEGLPKLDASGMPLNGECCVM